MSALFQENIDGTYSLHFKESELEVLTVLLANTQLGKSDHPAAALNLYGAIEDCIGTDGVRNICDAVSFEVEYDEDNHVVLKIGND